MNKKEYIKAQISIGVLCMALAFGITVQCRSVKSNEDNIMLTREQANNVLREENLSLKEKNADGIAFIKPWENDAIISKMKLAEDAGVFALGVDVDACGLVTLSLHGKNVEPKTLDKIILNAIFKIITPTFIATGDLVSWIA